MAGPITSQGAMFRDTELTTESPIAFTSLTSRLPAQLAGPPHEGTRSNRATDPATVPDPLGGVPPTRNHWYDIPGLALTDALWVVPAVTFPPTTGGAPAVMTVIVSATGAGYTFAAATLDAVSPSAFVSTTARMSTRGVPLGSAKPATNAMESPAELGFVTVPFVICH